LPYRCQLIVSFLAKTFVEYGEFVADDVAQLGVDRFEVVGAPADPPSTAASPALDRTTPA
jgi:hypothetical protein